MRMLIRYKSGLKVEAVVLAANTDKMRVVVNSKNDTMELTRVNWGWQTESGSVIEIEALLQVPGTDFSGVLSELAPRRYAAVCA
ncbi:MAG TPA: hypothetical protein VMH28_26090 [Candidatus Acidoferrales bacterium]|nr:hypothetical protein [Candidatus Acidoferrales bacterium]